MFCYLYDIFCSLNDNFCYLYDNFCNFCSLYDMFYYIYDNFCSLYDNCCYIYIIFFDFRNIYYSSKLFRYYFKIVNANFSSAYDYKVIKSFSRFISLLYNYRIYFILLLVTYNLNYNNEFYFFS